MVTIVGNGMGDYTFDNLSVKIEDFDVVVCDKNFKEEGKNILKLSYKETKEYILSNYKSQNILYVVTGSPLFFSAGTVLAKSIPKKYLTIIDNTSSKSYILSKLAISETDVSSISLHGRQNLDLRAFLKRKYTLILCDEKSLERLKEATKYLCKDDISWIIGYKMGYSDEYIGEFDPDNHNFNLKAPYTILLKRNFDNTLKILEDSEFDTERGMITKRYKRELSLQHLDLLPNLTLWDVGAGSGSCGIEAFCRYRTKVIFFEKNPKRVEFIKANLKRHRVCDTHLFEGDAVEHFDKIAENPDRVFIGGGGKKLFEKLPYLYDRLNKDGVMLIVAVTLSNFTAILGILEKFHIDYEVISLSLTTYKGKLKMAEPQRELFQIRITK
ncbi:precorrin-6Y C5,15-methyltransferase (decarboxylating) subunit CbiT [Hydrogenimonas thermophila]|uniref:precorrin-6Y C5,15-methyltransferase (decarboxylating) subunit CbiT n=1 Tax=Hydrogenimonas thermophila TaxID=223786 RepID=UPI002936D61B|nr:precorrin-6Y C5,15-methyltransferase (decarboxylating) subunit CbiT [Hydrogenimonas thermophila]WOE68962.1 precorrin-6Y C5,15-methyltransferase (decarboxylating) subunit CbiT [Hydrogenimonas thermophila]